MGRISSQGFTLIELLVVVTIIGILLVMLLPSYSMLGAKTRLQNGADTIIQMIDQARTFAVSGYKSRENDPALSVVGVEMHQGDGTFLLFSCPLLADTEIPCDLMAKHKIQQEQLGDIVLRSLANTEQPPVSYTTALILFPPPFGNGMVVADGHVQKTALVMEIGAGMMQNALMKKLEYVPATNRVNYE
jgi:prepilin-type N-terminal cleavage/methylation domain-containing protein